MSAITVDRFDLQLLKELQLDGQATNQGLGDKIHLSASQVSRRILRLQEAGVIDRYCALIDPSAIGLDVMAFTEVSLVHHHAAAGGQFEQEIARLPQVLECYTLAGSADYLLRIVAADLRALSDFMTRHILSIQGVANVKSTITLRRIKQTNVLPLDHVLQPPESKRKIQFTS
ncbi:AsnC family transcriptional regulator [Duganella sp. FT80W]|uniref:AsnC family transcriptional regulator n=1 Tax=Duganella guangzhouensis TaxID=2666084 RepID=A0A6I2L839_9BURK|nr:AsnC family transcriptional regulator [Duganella guangzhouensis]